MANIEDGSVRIFTKKKMLAALVLLPCKLIILALEQLEELETNLEIISPLYASFENTYTHWETN